MVMVMGNKRKLVTFLDERRQSAEVQVQVQVLASQGLSIVPVGKNAASLQGCSPLALIPFSILSILSILLHALLGHLISFCTSIRDSQALIPREWICDSLALFSWR